MFDNIFTAKILGMWEKRGFSPSPPLMQWCSPLLSHITMDCSVKKGGGGEGAEDILV